MTRRLPARFLSAGSCASLLLLGGALCAPPASAQDGQRWQEVEVVVFTHEDRASQVSERPLADPSRLTWLPRLTALGSVAEQLYYPFEQEALAQQVMALEQEVPAGQQAVPAEPAPVVFGPLPAPQASRSFRLLDQARDPFLALDDSVALLDQDLRRFTASGQHRILWHGTWRQPLLPAARAQAVFVSGGDEYGERHELEGSLRVSDSGGRAQLDLHLWFSSFLAGFSTTESAWSLPLLPTLARPQPAVLQRTDIPAAPDAVLGSWMSSGSWQLRDTSLLTEDATHYFDNPAIGVIVQIRPYSPPPRELAGGGEDF